ncbi:MAG: DUF2283 domain-containing protein [Candidatus Woesearchaeota archaeon]
MKHFHYDKENDILSVHKGFSMDESFKCNIDTGNLVLDMSTKDRLKGLEIMNATEFLKEFTSEALEDITDADFTSVETPSGININLVLKKKSLEFPAKIAVPLGV